MAFTELLNLRIMLPPLEQQQRIADAFDNYWNTTQALKENINWKIIKLISPLRLENYINKKYLSSYTSFLCVAVETFKTLFL